METSPFDLTPEQKALLAVLVQETGKSIPVLVDEALEVLQERRTRQDARQRGKPRRCRDTAPEKAYMGDRRRTLRRDSR
jgi:hypothetical protein